MPVKKPVPPPRPKIKKAPATESTLSAKARAIIARTKAAMAKRDEFIKGVVLDDALPVMVTTGPKKVRNKRREQSEEPEEMAIEAALGDIDTAAPPQARAKRSPPASLRGARPQARGKTVDDLPTLGRELVG